jgi:hypothetical protein
MAQHQPAVLTDKLALHLDQPPMLHHLLPSPNFQNDQSCLEFNSLISIFAYQKRLSYVFLVHLDGHGTYISIGF